MTLFEELTQNKRLVVSEKGNNRIVVSDVEEELNGFELMLTIVHVVVDNSARSEYYPDRLEIVINE